MIKGLSYVGMMHQTAPLAIRHKMRTDDDMRRAILLRLDPLADGRTILARCERFEIYAMAAMREIAA